MESMRMLGVFGEEEEEEEVAEAAGIVLGKVDVGPWGEEWRDGLKWVEEEEERE